MKKNKDFIELYLGLISVISALIFWCFFVIFILFAPIKCEAKTLTECHYELHKLNNELHAIMYWGYMEQYDIGQAQEEIDSVKLYTHEHDEFKQYMIRLKEGYDKSNDPEYFIKLARKKQQELEHKLKECNRIKNTKEQK